MKKTKQCSLTNHEANDGSKKGKHPENRGKGWDEMEKATKESTREQRKLPAKLVRDGTDWNTANKKPSEDDRCRDKSQRATFTHQVKL